MSDEVIRETQVKPAELFISEEKPVQEAIPRRTQTVWVPQSRQEEWVERRELERTEENPKREYETTEARAREDKRLLTETKRRKIVD